MKLKKFRVEFVIDDGKEKTFETVEIMASDEIAAHRGAFNTKIYPKYKGIGARFYVHNTEELNGTS